MVTAPPLVWQPDHLAAIFMHPAHFASSDGLLSFASLADVHAVHQMLCAAVDETVGEVPEFARQEKARFAPSMLRALSAANPAYVIIVMSPAGERAGFILSSPD